MRATGLYFFLVDRVPCHSAIADQIVAEWDFEMKGYVSLGILVASSSHAKVMMSGMLCSGVPKVTLCLETIDCFMLDDEGKGWCFLTGVSCRVCRLTDEMEKGIQGFSSCCKKLNAENEYFGG